MNTLAAHPPAAKDRVPLASEPHSSSALLPFLAELLAEQQTLDTPVARFASAHEDGRLAPLPDAQSGVLAHQQLIPLTAPRPGEQYAFEVDLDSCTGCKSCVAACHSLNGLDDEETWRDVGLLVSTDRHHPFTQTVTTACHHCADPGCLNGCPVLAYDKDPLTGIVRHLDDQCIGCSYCILKCPYDVPKYSRRLGIVRKCDMCHGRLAHGEAPACAQACPTHAIRIVTVTTSTAAAPAKVATDRSAARASAAFPSRPSAFLPAAPDPSYTQPTTRYVTRRGLPENIVAGDAATLRPQPAHWPLVVLLMFMPMAVGCGIADKLLDLPTAALAILCWLSGATGLAFSVAHLGRPLRAWRIFLGVRRSWLSREAVVFGAWFALATLYTAVRLQWVTLPTGAVRSILATATAVLGTLGLFCSVMIYADTRRHFWRVVHTAPRFFGSAVLLGLTSALASCAVATGPTNPTILATLLAVATLAKLLLEAGALAALNGDPNELTPALKSALLLAGPLRTTNELRITCGALGGILLPVMIATHTAPLWSAWVALPAVVAGELLERSLFFRAVDAPKMPGVPA